jgi:hypothetical protein
MRIKEQLVAGFLRLLDGPLTLDKAIAIAVVAHAGQEDKGKNSYIRHPLRVMEKMDSEDEMIVAVCHDTIEDTFLNLDDLAALGFTNNQIKTLDAVSRRAEETYEEFIQRVLQSYVGQKIKIQDIMDNSQLWRLKNRKLTYKDMERQQRYIDALSVLGGAKRG